MQVVVYYCGASKINPEKESVQMQQSFFPVDPTAVHLSDPVFTARIESCHNTTIPSSVAKCRETGRIDSFRLAWREGMPKRPHIFWDSDFAKVLEGMALALAQNPGDKTLADELDSYVDLVISAQQPDEYYRSKCDCELNNAADTAAAFLPVYRGWPEFHFYGCHSFFF